MRRQPWTFAIIALLATLVPWAPALRARAAGEGCLGGRIVFSSDRSGQPGLYTMSAQGGDVTLLTPGGHAPNWSRDGSKVVFDSFTSAGAHDIFTVNADGSGLKDLTNVGPGITQIDPAWSPDGTEIAFAAEPVGTRHAALWVMHANGSHRHQIANVSGAEEEHPSWSPEGTRLAFDAFPSRGPGHVYIVRADGTHLHRLTSDALDAWGPDWSPTAHLIVFANGGSAPTSDLFTIRPDGSGLTQLTHNPAGDASGLPAFSPNGTRITFSHFDPNGADVFRMTATGQAVRNLTNDPAFDYWSDWGRCPS